MTAIEDRNYYSDPRVTNAGKNTAPILYTDDGLEVELPWKWDVCPTCEGRGSHVNPSIDCNGLTSEDFCEDLDFGEAYMDGVYDVRCSQCNGRTTIPVVDWSALTDEQADAYQQQLEDEAADRACQLAELRMGA